MNKLQRAVKDIHRSGEEDLKRAGKGISPLARLLVTFLYIFLVVSFSKYDLDALAGMILYLLVIGIWEKISFKETIRHIWPVLLLVSVVGIANPFVERAVYLQIGNLSVTYGMVSMAVLMLKGIFSVTASWFLIMTTGIEGICYSLRCLHVPKELVTILLLIYRYLIVLLKEVERMMLAYKLRAPGQRGLHVKTWGAFVGQLLLRSMDRAETVYESMLLRGYHGEVPGRRFGGNKKTGILYVLLWTLVLICLRILPVFQMAGRIFG